MTGKYTEGTQYRPPTDCPVCGDHLVTTRLGCPTCGSEIAGTFAPCEFCSLSESELDVLKVFLASRGNIRELEKHLGVSYPTARQRLTTVLARLGLAGDAEPEPQLTKEQVLAEVASGALTPEESWQKSFPESATFLGPDGKMPDVQQLYLKAHTKGASAADTKAWEDFQYYYTTKGDEWLRTIGVRDGFDLGYLMNR